MKVDYMKPSPWKKIQVKDKTHRVLSNGTKIPTAENMYRQASKI